MSYNPCATCNRHDWCDMDIEENASVCDSKDLYLVYYVGQCEMGSDGYSSMINVCVASGNTEDEVVENYKENVKRLYGYDIHPTKTDSGQFVDYCPIKMVKIDREAYGHVRDYEVTLKYEKHEPITLDTDHVKESD